MSVQLDDLKLAWARMDVRQDGIEALLRQDVHDRHMGATRALLRRGLWGGALELLAWIAFTVCVASFWVDHRDTTHWLIIGLLLHVYGIAGIWATATQWFLLSRIHLFDAPVLVLQRRLAQLRRFRVYCTLGLGLPWWCLWLLVPMAGFYALTGVDSYLAAPMFVWLNMLVGVLGMAASAWLARRLSRTRLRSRFVQRIVDDISGCNLRRASTQLEELARFERD